VPRTASCTSGLTLPASRRRRARRRTGFSSTRIVAGRGRATPSASPGCGSGPATAGLGRWLRDSGLARTGHPDGVDFWPPFESTALAPRAHYCRAYADVLREAGVHAYDADHLD